MPIAPLQMLSIDAAFRLAGRNAHRLTVAGAEIVIGDAGTVILAEAADDRALSGVRNRDSFELVGPIAGEYAELFLGSGRVPPFQGTWEWPKPPASEPIHVFVRQPGSALYLGPVHQSRSTWSDGQLAGESFGDGHGNDLGSCAVGGADGGLV
ncbi:hypothetical protein ACSNOI_40830, partial [Actinomadura kijaniata]|uniref:hypothetical protein n=1 Tax=Actinomadura kijaniata TaxID=46161 RepID=UPI003F19EFC2